MADTAQQLMTEDEFLLWCLDKDQRFELVGGIPIEMMTGASRTHDRIIVNIIRALGNQLRGTPCTPATADVAVRTRFRSVRRPDVTVTCDPPSNTDYDAPSAKMVVEVLSPSNRGIAWHRKLDEYRGRDGLAYILLVESDAVGAALYQRAPGSETWTTVDATDRTAVFDLPQIACTLSLTDVYEGIDFEPAG